MSERRYKTGDILEVSVEKIVPNGLGLCFAEKLTLFVPLSAPGDRLRVEIRRMQGRRTAFARIVEVLEPSAERGTPGCVYFGTCGGCDFQHLSYPAQLRAKSGIIRDCLERIGKIEWPGEIPVVPSPEEYGYRLRTQLHADPRERSLGYFKRQSHEVIDVKVCPILVPPLEEHLGELRANLDWDDLAGRTGHIETAAGDRGMSVYADELLMPTEEVSREVADKRFLFNARSFFQGNALLIEELVETAVGGAKGRTALDLYCGVGLFSLFLADGFERVIGVEGDTRAIGFACRNAEHARARNIEFHDQRIKDFLAENAPENVDLVLLDPPRGGVKTATLERIADLGARHLTYVSCNPSTLARDLRLLLDSGYRIGRITALDLFPQTHHVETVVRLERRETEA